MPEVLEVQELTLTDPEMLVDLPKIESAFASARVFTIAISLLCKKPPKGEGIAQPPPEVLIVYSPSQVTGIAFIDAAIGAAVVWRKRVGHAAFGALLLAAPLTAGQIVTLEYLSSVTAPGADNFLLDGQFQQLYCDNFARSIPTFPYKATEDSLSDLSGSLLADDPDGLHKYQEIAILDLRAINDPSLAPDVVRAIRKIVDPSDPLTGGAANLLAWVATQDPASYDLSRFRIFASPDFQEQTGFIPPPHGPGGSDTPTPEPGTLILTAAGALLLFPGLRTNSSARKGAR